MVKIAVLDDYQDVARFMAGWDAIPGDPEITFHHDRGPAFDTLVKQLADVDILCTMRERTIMTGELLRALPALKLIAATGPDQRRTDFATANELGVLVSTTGAHAGAMVEFTWGLIIGLARTIAAEDAALRRGMWQTAIGASLTGKTLGIIGFGRLGRRIAAVAPHFGMRVVAWGFTLTPEEAAAGGAEYLPREELLRQSDVVSIHWRLSPRTERAFGAADLALMKPAALLVNTARGQVVDEAALVAALRERRIGGAALDVFEQEPLPPDHPLLRLPNTLLTPHIGYVTEEGYRIFYRDTVENIRAYLAGRPQNVYNPEALERHRQRWGGDWAIASVTPRE